MRSKNLLGTSGQSDRDDGISAPRAPDPTYAATVHMHEISLAKVV